MALTFAQGLVILQARIGDSSNSTAATQALNQAQREVARARRWPELMVRAFITTTAPYTTGTVAVSNGGTGWTLTDGVFPTDVETGAYRIAKSISDPWYPITTRNSGVLVTTAAYQGTTETASDYIVYKPQYSLASNVDRVEEVWLHDAGRATQLCNAATDEEVTDFLHYSSGPGVPTHYLNIERDASGYRQILLGPSTPDAVYRVEYVYRKQLTDGTLGLDDSRWPVVLARASAILYEPEFYDRHLAAQREYEQLLAREWESEKESETQSARVGDSRVRYPMGSDDYFDYLLGFGRVQDPS